MALKLRSWLKTMEAHFEEILKKYLDAKRKDSNIDLLSLKDEIESFMKDLLATDTKKDEKTIADIEDIMIDLTRTIEESHCKPFRSKKL